MLTFLQLFHAFSFLKEEADRKRPNMANLGELFESIADEHSTPVAPAGKP